MIFSSNKQNSQRLLISLKMLCLGLFFSVFLSVHEVYSQHPFKIELLKDINPSSNSTPSGFVRLNNAIYFSASDGVNGRELWISDGTSTGTHMFKDVHPGSGPGVFSILKKAGNQFFFIGDDGIHGQELWVCDGTVSGTFMVKDINPNPDELTSILFTETIGNKLFFQANDGVHGLELWVSDGTEIGTYLIKDIDPKPFNTANIQTSEGVEFNNLLFFTASDSAHGYELWATDGTESGTYLVKDIYTGAADGLPGAYYHYGGILFFTAQNDLGYELWKTDGTESGTVLVKDINTQSNALGTESSLPHLFTGYNGKVYFKAKSIGDYMEFWVTDGTENGTYKISDVIPGNQFIEFEGDLFFSGFNFDFGWELWRSDGTIIGTQLFVDFNTNPSPIWIGTDNSYLTPRFDFANHLILSGSQLHAISMLKDSVFPIYPELNTSEGIEFNGSLYFSSGELWRMYDTSTVGLEKRSLKDFSIENVFPNPNTGDFLNIAVSGTNEDQLEIQMINNSGQIVQTYVIKYGNNRIIQIPTLNLAAGLYFLKVKYNTQQEIVKIIRF